MYETLDYQKIDRIFIINLENRKDRKEDMMKEINRLNITNYEFFKAIRPTIEEVNKWNPLFCNNTYNKLIDKKNIEKFNKYKIGCLGCLKSHIEIYKLAFNRNYKQIMILEDDTEFLLTFDNIRNSIFELNYNYDMLYLTGNHIKKPIKYTSNTYKITCTLTTGSYIIKANTMQYILDNINSYDLEIDVFLANYVQKKFSCYCTYPAITTQKESYSDIIQTNANYRQIQRSNSLNMKLKF